MIDPYSFQAHARYVEAEGTAVADHAYGFQCNRARKSADAILALPALRAALPAGGVERAALEKLPCDVQLPGVILRRGCELATLHEALKRRVDWPEESTTLPRRDYDPEKAQAFRDALQIIEPKEALPSSLEQGEKDAPI